MNPDSMDMKKIKTIALAVVAVGIAMIGIVLLTNYATMGKIEVTTGSDNNSITLSQAGVSAQPSGFPKTATGSLSLSLSAGQYVVSVQNNSIATSQVVTVSAHTTQSYNLTPSQVSGVEPVIIGSVSDFAADNTGVAYLNFNDSKLTFLGLGNTHSELPAALQFQSVKWADPSFGVAQSLDGDLYVVDHQQVTPLNSPVSGQKSIIKDYAVAPDRTIYIGFASNVYRGTAGGTFATIYTSRVSGTRLVAGPGSNIALISGGESTEGAGDKTATKPGPGLVVIQNGGTVVSKDIDPVSAAWSASGKYLAVSTHDNSEILDSSLKQMGVIPEPGFGTPAWLDDNVLYYKLQDQLWSFNRTDQKSQVIANMPQGDAIQQISLSKDRSFIYASTSDDNNNLSLRRIGLRGQSASKSVYNLQDILPQTNDDPGYSLGLYNFSGTPAVTLTPYPGADAGSELQAVKQQLQGQGFDLGSLQFVVNSPATSQ